MKQAILSFILALLPILASADDSGTCGNKLTWSYVSSTKTLTISGTGKMTNYDSDYLNDITTAPWKKYASYIKKIIIESGVTSIGNNAFYGCRSLTSVTIGNSVTSIGNYAFDNCSGLTSVTIPNSVTSIGYGAFYYCSALKTVTIGNSVTSIGRSAFNGCSSLTSVTIGNSVTSIGGHAFRECTSLISITIPNSVTSIGESAFYKCSGLTSIEIPNSVTSIGENVFADCSALKTVTIPNSVTSIGSYAFDKCTGLTSVTIPNSVTSIGEQAFRECTSLISITIPNSVTSIGYSAFQNCTSLTSVTIGNSVKSIDRYVFYNCTSLTSVIIGNGVTFIESLAFEGTNLKKTIWLTNTPPLGYDYAKGAINYVSNDQFSSLRNVTKYQFLSSYFDVDGIIYVPVSPSERTCDAIDCVYYESSKETKIASTVSYKGITMNVKNIKPYVAYNNPYIESLTVDYNGAIPDYAFYGCKKMKSVNIGTKVNSLGTYAFYNCTSLKSIVIPDAVLSLGDYTFSGCSSMNSVKIGNGLTALPNYAFSSCKSLPTITIPKGVTTINNYVFSECTGLKKVFIADRETELSLGSNGSNPLFSSCPLDSVYIGGNISYKTSSSYGYSPFYRNTSLRAVNITDKETEISDNEFYGCTNLQRVKIGEGVTTIGKWAFSGCSSLKFFAFGSQVATIGQEAFSDCTAVTEIISKATTPPTCGSQALDDINKWECKLFVPSGSLTAYSAANQWKDFFFSEEFELEKCETPTITVKDGKIHFACATEGVTYKYYVTISNTSGKGNDITPSSMKLTVYASKPGYRDSDTATIEISASSGVFGDLTCDGKVDVADHVEMSNIIMNQNK